MNYDSDDSGEEIPKHKLPVASLDNSLEDDAFSTPQVQKASITLTPSAFDMSERKQSFFGKLSEAISPKGGQTDTSVRPKESGSRVHFQSETLRGASYQESTSDYASPRQKEIEKEALKAQTEFPNPMEDICGHDDLVVEDEIYYAVDEVISAVPSIEMVNKNHTRANILKNQRRKFYGTVTKMEKSIVRENEMALPNAWIDIQARSKATLVTLTRITEELKIYGFQNSPQEIKSYVDYFGRLRSLISKIDTIVDIETMNDPDMLKELLTNYIQQEDTFSQGISMQDLTAKFNPSLGASANMNSTRSGLNAEDDDNQTFADATHKPEDSDSDNETMRENPKTGRTFNSGNRSQGAYDVPPPLQNLPPIQPGGPGGPGGPPPGPFWQPPWGGQWGGPPPPQRPPFMPQQQQQWAGNPQQQFYQYPPQRYPPQPNYQGIKKVQCEKFAGDELEFRRFKLTFDSAYVKNRNLPHSDLALMLIDSLKGEPLAIVTKYIRNTPAGTDMSYAKIWRILEERYGGLNVEDSHIVEEFKNAQPIRNTSLKEIERIYDVISVQHAYYKINDPHSLNTERSLLFQMGKAKLNPYYSDKFVRHCDKNKFVPNFTALKKFLKTEFKITQTTEREYKPTKFALFSAKTITGDEDEEQDQSQAAEVYPDDDSADFSFFVQNNRTGQKFGAKDFQNQRRPQGFGNQTQRNPMREQRALSAPAQNFGGFRGGQRNNVPLISQFKEGQCSCCRQAHSLPNCPKFKALAPNLQSAIVRRDRICYHCLLAVHFTRNCKTDEGKKCGIDGCELYHHKVLHRDPKVVNYIGHQIESECKPAPPTDLELAEVSQEQAFKIAQPGAISIQTLVCYMLSAKQLQKRASNVKTIVLIDTGSNVTCIDEDFAEEHNLRKLAERDGCSLHLLNDVVTLPGKQYQVELQLSSMDQTCTKNVTAWTIKDLAKSTSVVDWSEKKKHFPHLADVNFPKLPNDATIKIIMGVDNSALYAPILIVANNESDTDPVAMQMTLGWTCLGRSSPANYKNEFTGLEKDPKKIFKNVLFASPAKPITHKKELKEKN